MTFAIQNLSTVKKLLLVNFFLLFLFQIFVGFKDLDDYLVIFVFALFVNDLYLKLTRPARFVFREEKKMRIVMSIFLAIILLLPFMFEYFHVRSVTQSFVYKMGLIFWAQVFLLDSFKHYNETHSRKWLLFANVAGIFILFFSFAI